MSKLVLLNFNGRRVPGPVNFREPHGQYLNILVLFDEYGNAKGRLRNDRAAIVKYLFSIAPFNDLSEKVNIFTAEVKPRSGQPDRFSIVSKPPEGGEAFLDTVELKSFIETLSFPGFIESGRDVWLDGPTSDNRSYGCVGVISGKFEFRGVHWTVGGSPNWPPPFKFQPATLSFFVMGSSIKPGGSSYLRVARDRQLGGVFVHELGHGLGLADEYEKRPPDGGVHPGHTNLNRPNVISKYEILKSPTDWKKGSALREDQIDRLKIPWGQLITEPDRSSFLVLNPSRWISIKDCPVGDWLLKEALCHQPDKRPYWVMGGPIGLYEGAATYSYDVFRPLSGCNMRNPHETRQSNLDDTNHFCPVCEIWIRYRLVEKNLVLDRAAFQEWLKYNA